MATRVGLARSWKSMMKILVTGGCGTLGRAVVAACEGVHEAVAFDRTPEAVALGGVQGDITDAEALLDAASGCDAIIHAAALHGSNRHTHTTAKYIATNVVGGDHVFQAAVGHNIRHVVTASTMEVHIGRDGTASGMTVLDEQSPPKHDWIYPVTKLQVETLGQYYVDKYGINIAHLRYYVFGEKPWRDLGYSLVVHYISKEDAAAAALAAVQVDGLRNEVFLIGPDTPLGQPDINDVLNGDVWPMLERHWPGCRAVLEPKFGQPSPRDYWPVARINKAKLMLGWKPTHTFELLLRELGWRAPGEGESDAVKTTRAEVAS